VLNAILRRLAALEAIPCRDGKRQWPTSKQLFAELPAPRNSSAVQREQCEALWCRIQALAKTDPCIAGLFVSEGGVIGATHR
jgi:hypothetical protein